jgi:hypothetical protein
MDTGGFFLGVKRLGRGADPSSPSSAEVFKSWCLINDADEQLLLHRKTSFAFYANEITYV